MNATTRIIKNTAVSYIALIIRMFIGLFAVRLVLHALGESDYGIYILVAGVVAMLDILSSSMSSTSNRYMSYSLGSGKFDNIKQTFCTTLYIHLLLALVTAVILEIGGWICFKYIMQIPADRLTASRIVYQFMVITTLVSVVSVPYDAVVTAHEDLFVLSLFGVLQSFITLIFALSLKYVPGDRLIWYGIFNMTVLILMRCLKVLYSRRHYLEVKEVSTAWLDVGLFKSIFSFTAWNLFGSISGVAITKVRGLLINMFYGVRLNASEGVSSQVLSVVNTVSTSMTSSIDPQIMKSEGCGKRSKMVYLTVMGSKYSAALFALVALPLFFEVDYLLTIWLGTPPQYAALFIRLIIIYQLIEKFTFQITRSIRAVGNIKSFTIAETVGNCLYLPFAFLWFKVGGAPETIYYLTICSAILVGIIRLIYGHKLFGLNVPSYINEAVVKVIVPIMIATVLTYVPVSILHRGVFRLCVTCAVFCLSFILLLWFVGMSRDEKTRWRDIIFSICRRKNTTIDYDKN